MSRPKGMQIKIGEQADLEGLMIRNMIVEARFRGFMPVRIPSVWSVDTFVAKAGEEILDQMYVFEDKKGRPMCLIPEVTAIIAEQYKESWAKSPPKPVKVFYISRCYRYENVQAGRYREFIQFGVEYLGGSEPEAEKDLLLAMAESMIVNNFDGEYDVSTNVKRGLDYYVEDGFEFSVPILGAQKQVVGGGRYDCGIGYAIGVDRLLLANEKVEQAS